jgi:S1-C subfamily serine protease
MFVKLASASIAVALIFPAVSHASPDDNTVRYWLGTKTVVDGGGIPKDPVLAYAWMNLAAIGYAGDQDAIRARQGMESVLSADELTEVQRLSSSWEMRKVLSREGTPTNNDKPSITGGLVKASTGTLFMVSKSGHAITNFHVAGRCTELRIQGCEGIAKLVADDKFNDLALVQVQGAVTDFSSIVSDPGKLRQGEDVVVFGYSLSAVLSSGGNLTPAIVSALTGLGNNTNQIQISAPIQPGSSGSPVLNRKGDVIGVVSMKLPDEKMAKATGQVAQNINFAVSEQTLKTFLDTHKVPYSTSSLFLFEKNLADLGDEARKWTMVCEC